MKAEKDWRGVGWLQVAMQSQLPRCLFVIIFNTIKLKQTIDALRRRTIEQYVFIGKIALLNK